MLNLSKIQKLGLYLIISAIPMMSYADDLDKRVQRLEQIVENRQQLDLANQFVQLQQAVETLRGEMDVQSRALQELTERQQMLYQDIDQRLAKLEGQGGSQSPIAPLYPEPKIPAPANATPEAASVPTVAASSTPVTTTPISTTATPQQDQAAYQHAYQLLLEKKYPQSIEALNLYLRDYPQGTYRANAYYWLGEVYLIENQPQQAQQAFNTVLKEYPQNPKSGDALLKLGYAYAALGDKAQAKTVLNQVLQQYPNTPLARLAEVRLTELS